MNLDAARAADGWMADDELIWLAEQAQSAKVIIEVGCWKGRSTLALADNTTGKVYAVDHWQGTPEDAHLKEVARLGGADGLYQTFLANLDGRIESRRVVPMRMDAGRAAVELAVKGIFPDLVFLDGDHRVEAVRRDIDTYRSILKVGGILCGHDYACPSHAGVTQAVNEAFPTVNRAGLSIWWVRL